VKPILIVQHEDDVAPGHFEAWLLAGGRPYQTLRVDRGERMPETAAPYSGLCSLGGVMSVNDPLPWIDQEIELMRDADRRSVPVIGHCLGGQLISRAFGARVVRAQRKEIGWGRVEVLDTARARDWTDQAEGFEVFQWHGDRFELPADARLFLGNDACANQAYVLERRGFAHLAMQFHIEMTPALVRRWADDPGSTQEISEEVARNGSESVQTAAQMVDDLEVRAARMGRIAERLYRRWAEGLRD
jgi:GMP synthase-like glutamine amidotransferase